MINNQAATTHTARADGMALKLSSVREHEFASYDVKLIEKNRSQGN